MASKGGKAAAAKMTPEQRAERAKKAAAGRWKVGLPRATHGGEDHPLRIGDVAIPAYVLNDGRRVLSQGGMLAGMKMSLGSGSGVTGNRLTNFITGKALTPYVSEELREGILNPIRFVTPGEQLAYGYLATVLADVCDVVLKVREAGKLHPLQWKIAQQCEVLVRGFARVGIIALVDEATGYQDARERDALAKILEAFVAKELRPYVKTFKPDFYKAICDLKGWTFKTSSRRPRALAQITNDLVYRRLAPGVLEELQRKNPVVKDGRRKSKHFQWLTDQKGHPELLDHVGKLTGWAEMAKEAGQTYDQFLSYVNRRKPIYTGRTLLALADGDTVEVNALRITGEVDEVPTVIDLIEDRIIAEVKVEASDRRTLPYSNRRASLREVWEQQLNELEAYGVTS